MIRTTHIPKRITIAGVVVNASGARLTVMEVNATETDFELTFDSPPPPPPHDGWIEVLTTEGRTYAGNGLDTAGPFFHRYRKGQGDAGWDAKKPPAE